MTTASTPPPPPGPEEPGPLLTAHAAIVLLIAAALGTIAGALTALRTGDTAAPLLAGMGVAGLSVPVLHRLIGA
ncbi:hypothetical protein [Streptomyces lavendofoliae]|uniref:hypothetical protein n=1 Tax=Streptomyces lavendofoliae TaxID=67314 RepID=UPI003D94E609